MKKKELLNYFQDKSKPLEERWKLYVKQPEKFRIYHDTCFWGDKETTPYLWAYMQISYCDGFFPYAQNEYMVLNSMVKEIEKRLAKGNKYIYSADFLKGFKEDIMALNIGGSLIDFDTHEALCTNDPIEVHILAPILGGEFLPQQIKKNDDEHKKIA